MYEGERFSSISHLIGAALALMGAVVLITMAANDGNLLKIISFSIYGLTLFWLYLVSTLYHSLRGRAKRIFRVLFNGQQADKAIDEFQIQNKWMEMSDFKFIYWWEWGHRQLGRVVGLVWAIGFFWFLLRRKIPVGWTPKLLGLGAQRCHQCAVGQHMGKRLITHNFFLF